ncbi:uncharacterized protein FTJAE_5129 [Fusarium tjaetaba]|uniref:Uncharacterized protein n=1 Tax=Fusarium tjaetaba TaxID=1567544 RepID=A0A8H5RSC1_9HYPO|nr:uncharacterized protein FTJAE_5129 [Fusarium tjaetaba]KAF5638742.1 hypothetical protein FTJAE_5129 [Fusarium tjaetaba]
MGIFISLVEDLPGGLHYIGLDWVATPVRLDRTVIDEFQRARSGYELEKGLWTACWDSHAAAIKHEQQRKAKFKYCCPPSTTPLDSALWRFGSSAMYEPVLIEPSPREGRQIVESQKQKIMVYPSPDIFCVALNRGVRAACSGHSYPLREFRRLTFEFKPSWNAQLSQHDNYYPIKKFKPSLAFILQLVFDAAHIRRSTTPTIRLIDRNARWINDDTTQLGLDTFYDCDYEYVEISMKPGSSSARIVCHSPILEFFDHLDRLLEDKLQNVGPFSRWNWHWQKFVIRDSFSIIALRKNQVGAAKE